MPSGSQQCVWLDTLVRVRHELVMKILHRAQEEGYLDPDEDLVMLRAMSHTYMYGVITKMLLGDLSRWTPGSADQDAARMAVQVLNRKMFKPAASCARPHCAS